MTDPALNLTGVARHMQAVALNANDKFLYMVGELVGQVQHVAHSGGDTDQRLVDVARAVARSWMQQTTEAGR